MVTGPFVFILIQTKWETTWEGMVWYGMASNGIVWEGRGGEGRAVRRLYTRIFIDFTILIRP